MICPLYDFCKYSNRDSLDCSNYPSSCSYFKTVNKWISNKIDLAIENALEDLQ